MIMATFHKKITSGQPSHNSDYLWSPLTKNWLPFVTPHTAVITTGYTCHNRGYHLSPYTVVISSGQHSQSKDYLWHPSQSSDYLW